MDSMELIFFLPRLRVNLGIMDFGNCRVKG